MFESPIEKMPLIKEMPQIEMTIDEIVAEVEKEKKAGRNPYAIVASIITKLKVEGKNAKAIGIRKNEIIREVYAKLGLEYAKEAARDSGIKKESKPAAGAGTNDPKRFKNLRERIPYDSPESIGDARGLSNSDPKD